MEQKELMTNALNEKLNTTDKNKRLNNYIANIFLLLLGIMMSVSGLIIQIHYHVSHNPDASTIFFLGRTAWYSIHMWTSTGFLLITVYHTWVHRKWYKNVLQRKVTRKSRPTMILTFLMVATTISGFIPLFLSLFESNSFLRFAIIEIHDKIAITFLIIAFFHTQRRLKWSHLLLSNNKER